MLPKDLRLPSYDIASLMRQGKRTHQSGIDFVFRKTSKGKRFAFIISTKVEKRATARNRIKRLFREAVAAQMVQIQDGIDGIIVVKGKTPDEYEAVSGLLMDLFKASGVLRQ